jgi:two-component system CheB/CheR fusion protein
LTNAIKYTPDGGNIWLALSREGSRGVIHVRDNGRGIAPELLGSIFDMFVQSDDTLDRSDGGMGVGLTLVRSLVELHGGTIEARSSGTDRGSEFTIRLPPTTKRPSRASLSSDGHDPQNVRLVLVEDCADTREMFAALLAFEGYHVQTAADGQEGLDLIRKTKPNLALLDVGLPKLDGYELARRVREEFTKDEIYLIALTGYGSEEDQEAVLEAGFDKHLVKPVDLQELKVAISKAVNSKQMERSTPHSRRP